MALEAGRIDELTTFTKRVRDALRANGVTGRDGADIDHIELMGPPADPTKGARNFVLCPGKAYDRSPCGTGTSAKLACLAADGKLAEGEAWVQEGIVGGRFTARYRWLDRARGEIAPTITGSAFVNSEGSLLLDPADPFCWGIRA